MTVGMMVRMSADLRDRIKAAAEINGRSQNSEIIATLEEAYPVPEDFDPFRFAYLEWVKIGPDASQEARQEVVRRVNERFAAEGEQMTVAIDDKGTMSFTRPD